MKFTNSPFLSQKTFSITLRAEIALIFFQLHTMNVSIPVSYTHLDVYKRQVYRYISKQCSIEL